MPINDDELLAAVSSATDAPSTPAASETPPQETNTNEDADDTAVDSDVSGSVEDGAGDTGADGAADETDAGDEPADKAAEGDETEAAGGEEEPVDDKAAKEPKVGDPNPATGKPYTAEEIQAKKAADDKAAFLKQQTEDPINAPIPKYLKEATGKRMTKLVEIAKDLTTKHAAAQADRDLIVGQIVDTGANAQQYGAALSYLKMVNSGDPEQIKTAIGVMQAELAALSRMAGIVVPGVDLLANHADLKAAVEAKQLTKELAEEIAAGREQRSVQTQQSRAAQQGTQEAQRAHAEGVKTLNQIGAQLKAANPAGYAARAQAVLAKIGDQLRQAHPSQWGNLFLTAYATYQPPRKAAPVAAKPPVVKVPKNQPLRGNNPSGGQQKAAGSLEEAINFGIAQGTRR